MPLIFVGHAHLAIQAAAAVRAFSQVMNRTD
jgi:hypothetical protein